MSKQVKKTQPSRQSLEALNGPGSIHARNTNRSALPSWKTNDIRKRMAEEFDYDPLREMIAVARGEELTTDHPFLPILLDALALWAKASPTKRQLDRLAEQARHFLTDSWVPHDIRARAVTTLLAKVYPNAKALEIHHSGNINHDIAIKPLNNEEAKTIEATFERLY